MGSGACIWAGVAGGDAARLGKRTSVSSARRKAGGRPQPKRWANVSMARRSMESLFMGVFRLTRPRRAGLVMRRGGAKGCQPGVFVVKQLGGVYLT